MTAQREDKRERRKRKHYKCARCQKFFRRPSDVENHIDRDHSGMGYGVFDEKGSTK